MKYFKFISIVVILLSINACQEKGLAGEIDSIRSEAKDLLEDSQAIDSVIYQKEYKKTLILLDKVLPFFQEMDKFSQKKIADLASIEKWHRKTVSKPAGLQKNLEFSVTQLDALYFEYKSDSINELSAKEYLLTEEKQLKILSQQVHNLETQTERLDEAYSRLIPQVQHIADSLENAN